MKAFFHFRIFLQVLAALVVFSAGADSTRAQQADSRDRQSAQLDNPQARRAGLSELAGENYGVVAASALEINAALIKDPGLVVELKLMIAKEASDSGQIVNERDLTDQAVNDRLVNDIRFRAKATRLLQRYGYLVPKVNPDSDAGKQQEFFIKERARLQALKESREESEPPQSQRMDRTAARVGNCDQGDAANPEDSECEQQPAVGSRRNVTSPRETPQQGLQQSQPTNPQAQPRTNPRILTAQNGIDGMDQDSSLTGYGDLANGAMGLTNISDPQRRPSDALSGMNPSPGSMVGGPLPSGFENQIGASRAANVGDLGAETLPNSSGYPRNSIGLYSGGMNPRRDAGANRDLNPVAMVRRPNPYSDVPSLYDLYVQAASRDREPRRFGAEVFKDGLRDPRAVPMDLPVGPEYVVGPGDTLSIDLWGGVSTRLVRAVDREGRVNLPEAGPLQVSGRSLGEVQLAVQRAISTQFRDTSADVSVSRLRTVRIYVVGEVQVPGAYDISSLSTVLNALVAAGGVTPRGSLRELKHYRGRQLVETVDAYDLLLHGVAPDALKLENGDSLQVPPIGAQVTITGMVRRPAVYELNGEKSLSDALDLAGGILPAAALKHVEVQRVEAHEKRTMLSLDLTADNKDAPQLVSFRVQDGDQIHIFPIAPYNQDTIYLQGHVLRPGKYSFRQGTKLGDLIGSYKDLLPEPAAHYAEIVRLNPPDFRPSVQSFDLAAAMANPAAAPSLEPLDTVRVFSKFDFEPAPAVWVGGEVRTPGRYVMSGQSHLRDAIFLAGGLTPDASMATAQLFRTEADGNTKILSVNLGTALSGDPTENILLQPRDRLLIQRSFERVDPPTVDIKGEVAKPGRYPLTGNMKVQDLIRVAGGLKRSADTNLANLTSYPVGGKPGQDTDISLASLANGNSTEDVPLRNGDVLTIRQVPGWKDLGASVSVRGEVQHPGGYGIQPGEKLSSVLTRAGGYTKEAFPYGAVLMRTAVRDVEEKQHSELVRRVEVQQANIKLLPENDQDQKNAKLTAISQTQATLDQLRLSPPVGRLVIHIDAPVNKWRNTSADIAMRDGDVLVIPKSTDYVMVTGQVFNPTAISYKGGRSANWYLGQAGGLTQTAEKKGIFVVRADGSVISARNSPGIWAGDPLDSTLRPGDTVVVPEKALNIGNKNWTNLLQTAQIATSIALTVAYIK